MLARPTPLGHEPLYQRNTKTTTRPKENGFKERWHPFKSKEVKQVDASERMIEHDRVKNTAREQYSEPSTSTAKKPKKNNISSKLKNQSQTDADVPKPPVKAAHPVIKSLKFHDTQNQENSMLKEGKSILKEKPSEELQRHPIALKTTKLLLGSNSKKENHQQIVTEKNTSDALKTEFERESFADKNIEKKQFIKEKNVSPSSRRLQKIQKKLKKERILSATDAQKEEHRSLNTENRVEQQVVHADQQLKAKDLQKLPQDSRFVKLGEQRSRSSKETVSLENQRANPSKEQLKEQGAVKTFDLPLEKSSNSKKSEEQTLIKTTALKSNKTAKVPTLHSKEPAQINNNSPEQQPLKAEKAEIIIESAAFETRSNSALTTRPSFTQMLESRVNQLLESPQGHLIKQLQVQLQNQQQAEIRLSLQPEQLGEVRLHVRLQGEQARTQISVEQNSTAELMQQALSSFAQSFSEHGYEQTEFDIVVEENSSPSAPVLPEPAPSLMQQGGDFLLRGQRINYII